MEKVGAKRFFIGERGWKISDLFFFSLILLFFSFAACSLPDQEGFQKKAEKIQEAMVEDLKEVSCKEDLIEKIPALKKNYKKIAKLLKQASESFIEEPLLFNPEPSKTSLDLYREFLRIYEIPGGKEILERIQKEAALLLPKEPLTGES